METGIQLLALNYVLLVYILGSTKKRGFWPVSTELKFRFPEIKLKRRIGFGKSADRQTLLIAILIELSEKLTGQSLLLMFTPR